MPSLEEQISQLQSAIAAQEALRPTLGDAIVEITLTALRSQVEALRTQQAAAARPQVELSPEELLARLQSYLPTELAAKMRATGRIEGERKQVTVLFADLSGFTALSERLDAEEVATLTNEALKALAEAVYQYEGYIDKFVGDAIMAVFGAPVAHEDDPERALRAALAMRERLEGFNRRWGERLGEPIELHIGINTGPVIAGNVGSDLRLSYTVMGDTVNTASRLEDAAAPGQILVSRDTYRLVQEAFTFEVLEPIRVKGKREPLTVFELQRARLHPGKSRGLQGLSSAQIGREREMAFLRGVLGDLEAGRGRIVTITGEAGIGKSRLMAECRAEFGDHVLWLEGQAFAHTTTLAYGPFLDLLRRYAGIRDEDSEAQARARLNATVDRLFPRHMEAHAILANLLGMRLTAEEVTRLAGFRAEAFRRRLFGLVEELFVRLAGERPTVLVLEDMHWADATSMELVEHLLPLTGQVSLGIVNVFRLQPDDAPSKLQAAIETRYADRFTHLPLMPLSQALSLEMVEELLATRQLPAALRAMIVSKAEGNPFFVEEVIRSLMEWGALIRADTEEGWVATPLIERVSVPDTLQGLLMARLDRLPEETKRVAQQAAIIGRIFLYRVLLQISENTPGLDADLSHLERQELIRERARQPEVEYIFKHALTQEVAYQSLLTPRRKELHCRVGEAMEAIFAERLDEFNSIVANHFLRGEAWEKACEYLIKTGDAATRLYAHAEARLHYGQALEALSHLPDTAANRRGRIDTIIKQVSVSFLAEGPERNLARLAEAEALVEGLSGPDGMAGEDRLRLARVHYWMGRSHFYGNKLREAVSYYHHVLEVAREFGDEELLAIPTGTLGRVVLLQGRFGKAAALLSQAVGRLEKAGSWSEWVYTVSYLGIALAMCGQYEAGLVEAQRALARAVELNFLPGIAPAHLCLGVVHFAGGDIPRMLEASDAGRKLAEEGGEPLGTYIGLGWRAWAESRMGYHDAAMATMAQARAISERLGSEMFCADWFAAANAEIHLSAGDVREALALAEATVSFAQSKDSVFSEGIAHRIWAQALGAISPSRWKESEAHMGASVRALESGEAVLEAARTHVAWGQVCRAHNAPAAACDHLQMAAARFMASGLHHELDRTRQLIDALKG